MKKALITLVMVIVALSMFYGIYVFGRNVPLNVKDSGVVLLKPTKQWAETYGESYNSQVNFTIASLIAVVNRQGEVITKLTNDVNNLKMDVLLSNSNR